jgi:hypothetical protein
VSDTDTQSPPDSRMNRSSEDPDRLSLRWLLLSAPLVTSPTQVVSNPASSHISHRPSRTLVATFSWDKDSLSVTSHTRLSSHLRFPADPVKEAITPTDLGHEVSEPA